MGKSLGAYVSDKVLFPFPGDPKGTAKRGDASLLGTLEQLIS